MVTNHGVIMYMVMEVLQDIRQTIQTDHSKGVDILVEKIIINPIKVRGYGNIVEDHEASDYGLSQSIMSKVSDTVYGVVSKVYTLVYSVFGFMFGFDDGAKQLYLQAEDEDTLSLGFDASNKQLYILNDTEETVSFGFSNKKLYIEVGE